MSTPLNLTPEQLAFIQSLSASSPEPEPEGRPERVVVKPPPNSRLEALLCEYSSRKKAAQEAEAKFKELKAAIGAELENLYPPEQRPSEAYEIPPTMMYPEITFQQKKSWYLPDGVIREYLPQVYDTFKKEKAYWELREAQRNARRRR